MFNFAKRKRIPERFREQALYHEKIKQEDPKGEQSAMHLAFVMMGQNISSVKDAMVAQDQTYWEYVELFDKHYFKNVLKTAHEAAKELVEIVKTDPSMLPLPPKEEGGGGMGDMGGGAPPPPGGAPPPPMASGKGRIVTSIVLPGGMIASNVGGPWLINDDCWRRPTEKEKVALNSLRTRDGVESV